MNDRTTSVTVRVGERSEYVVGHLACDPEGRVRLEQLADLMMAVAEHMRVIVDHAERHDQQAKENE
jgi:anti-sigma regulatory factor (Ser/Thr protein kinase)